MRIAWVVFLQQREQCGVALLDSPSEILPLALQHLGLDPNSNYLEHEERLWKTRIRPPNPVVTIRRCDWALLILSGHNK